MDMMMLERKLSELIALKERQLKAAQVDVTRMDELTTLEVIEVWKVLYTETFRWEVFAAELEVWKEIADLLKWRMT